MHSYTHTYIYVTYVYVDSLGDNSITFNITYTYVIARLKVEYMFKRNCGFNEMLLL